MSRNRVSATTVNTPAHDRAPVERVSKQGVKKQGVKKQGVKKQGVKKQRVSKAAASEQTTAGCNVAVLHGVVRSEPVTRTLPSGDVLVSFDLRVPGPDARVSATPVSWIGPSAQVPEILAADEVVVIGQVARRFFRTRSGLGSRVDVRAARIVTGSTARRNRAMVAAQALLS